MNEVSNPNAIVRTVRAETHVTQNSWVEERHLHVVPIFLIDCSVPLNAPIEELFSAELIVDERVGGEGGRGAILGDALSIFDVTTGRTVKGAGRKPCDHV